MLRRRRGFKLIELLIVVVIIGLLSAVVIPSVQVSIYRARLKSTMKNIAAISKAISAYSVDNGILPAQSGTYDPSSPLYNALSPFYIKVLPLNDQWDNGFRVWCGKVVDGNYGISGASSEDFLVASFGRDKEQEDDFSFNTSSPEDGFFKFTQMSDFDKDLVMWNNVWIRRPMGVGD